MTVFSSASAVRGVPHSFTISPAFALRLQTLDFVPAFETAMSQDAIQQVVHDCLLSA
jgi:hypothetical protein